MSLDKDRNADPHPSRAEQPITDPRGRSTKNQPGLRPSPQPNDPAIVRRPESDEPNAPLVTTTVPVTRDTHAELREAELDLAKIKRDPMTADHAIRGAEARVRGLKEELGQRG